MPVRSRAGSALLSSPRIDPFNRRRHRGDFGLRVPSSQRAMREFLAAWRDSLEHTRKPTIACRNYVMGKIAYIWGMRDAELYSLRIGDLHRESGEHGRFLVRGKGANGSGPRQREAYMFFEGRELAVTPGTFRSALKVAAEQFLKGPVTTMSRRLDGIFRPLGLTPSKLRQDRLLDEARHAADPVHLMRVLVSARTAMNYVYAAHPEKRSSPPR